MKIRRNGPPSQPWDATFRSGNFRVTYRVTTPQGKEHYDLAKRKATELMEKDPIWEEDKAEMIDYDAGAINPELEVLKYAKPRKRPTQTWVGGKISEGGYWKKS